MEILTSQVHKMYSSAVNYVKFSAYSHLSFNTLSVMPVVEASVMAVEIYLNECQMCRWIKWVATETVGATQSYSNTKMQIFSPFLCFTVPATSISASTQTKLRSCTGLFLPSSEITDGIYRSRSLLNLARMAAHNYTVVSKSGLISGN